MVHQYNFDQEEDTHISDTTHIQPEEVITIKTQHQFMHHLTNQILMIHTQEVALVGYHKKLPKN